MNSEPSSMPDPIPPDDASPVVIQNTMWTHIIPFAAWLVLLTLLPPSGWSYAVRTATGIGLLLWCCPWRWYPRLVPRHLPLASLVGVIVFVVWVAPEAPPLTRWPLWQRLYPLLGIMPPWSTPEPLTEFPYAPETCGWLFTLVRLFGSSVVVAIIEEFFWRGFLYRWMYKSNFLAVDPARFQWFAFLAVALLFGLEHDRWAVGFLAGIAYGWLYIRTKDIWATTIAHGITNFLLALYVLHTKAWQFW